MYPFAYLCQRSFLRRQSISEKWLYCSLLHSQSTQRPCSRKAASSDASCSCVLIAASDVRSIHAAVVGSTGAPCCARLLHNCVHGMAPSSRRHLQRRSPSPAVSWPRSSPPNQRTGQNSQSFRMQHQSLADCMSDIEAVAGWLSSPREQEAGRIPVSCPSAAVGALLHLYRAAATAPLSCAAAAERCMNRE